MSDAERIGKLMFRYVRKELSRAEAAELNAWRQSSDRNEQLFREETEPENIRKALKAIYESEQPILLRIKEQYPGPWQAAPVKTRARMYRMVRIAAIFVIVLGAGLYFLFRGNSIRPGTNQARLVSTDGVSRALDDFHRGFLDGLSGVTIKKDENGDLVYIPANDPNAGKDQYFTLSTPRGGYFSIKLPDGTRVWLNAQSSLKYPANYLRDSVTVELTGEAYFEMARDSTHPFAVSLPLTNAVMYIESSAARFNLSSYADEPFTGATLLDGQAMIRLDAGTTKIDWPVIPNQQVLMGIQTILTTQLTDTAATIAWKKGRIFYPGTDIKTILRAVSRWYDADIVYGERIPDKRFHLDLPRGAAIREVLNALRQQGLHCSISGRTIYAGGP